MVKDTFATKGEAAIALRALGMSSREIGAQLGVQPKTVPTMIFRAEQRKGRRERQVGLDPELYITLRAAAERRGENVPELVQALLRAIAQDNLIDAVLDEENN